MYEDGHDEIVLSVDQPCQLLGVGLCGTEGAYTAELELLEACTLKSVLQLSTAQAQDTIVMSASLLEAIWCCLVQANNVSHALMSLVSVSHTFMCFPALMALLCSTLQCCIISYTGCSHFTLQVMQKGYVPCCHL